MLKTPYQNRYGIFFIALFRLKEKIVDDPPEEGIDKHNDKISPSPRLWKPNPVGNPKQKGSDRNI